MYESLSQQMAVQTILPLVTNLNLVVVKWMQLEIMFLTLIEQTP